MDEQQHSDSVPAFLEAVHLAPRQTAKQLTLWPLIGPDGGRSTLELPYVPLCDALARGDVQVEEIGGGTVPHVSVRNRGKVPVLVLFGEEIVGAKQNRIANASFLVAPRQRVEIDVSCVEAGRWSSAPGAAFRASDHVVSASLRAAMVGKVTESRATTGSYAADQHEVWEGVSQRLKGSGVTSPSAAYFEYAHSRASEHDAISGAFPCVPGQVGFVAMIGDRVVGAEGVGEPKVYARVHDRLLRAYTVDAVDAASLRRGSGRNSGSPGGFDSPEAFLAALKDARRREGSSLGLGQDVRLEGEAIDGCALALDGEVVHLTAFAAAENRPRSDGAGGPSGGPRSAGRRSLDWLRGRLRGRR